MSAPHLRTPLEALALLREWEREFPGLSGVADALADEREELFKHIGELEERLDGALRKTDSTRPS